MFESEAPMEMLIPPEQTVVKETIFALSEPKIEPITFSLQESDEGNINLPDVITVEISLKTALI